MSASASAPPRLVLVPGLGADARLMVRQHEAFAGLIVPAWLDPRPSEPLREYAARLAATIPGGGPVIVGGASMGGMLATEMAVHLNAIGVIQIGSCRSPREISPAFVDLERSSRGVPDVVARAGLVLAPGLIDRVLGPVNDEERSLLLAMARDISMPFIRWAARAIMEWSGAPASTAPIRAIHGTRDRVIPFRRVRADEAIQGAGHVPNLTHGPVVNAFIAKCVREFTGGAPTSTAKP